MKRKVLVCTMVAFLVFGMVSCSMDEYAKLGDLMGKMGSNVYGIEPNMSEVNATSEKLDNSVEKDESGKVTISTEGAADLISSLAEIKNSTQKTSAMKDELSKNVTDDEEYAAEVKAALKESIDNVLKDYQDSVKDVAGSDVSDEIKNACASVNNALEDIQKKIGETDSPTKADLATVAIVKSLAETVQNVAENPNDYTKDELIEKAGDALQALDALKVAADAAGMGDILSDISIASLLSSGKSVGSQSGESSKAIGDADSDDRAAELAMSVAMKISSLVSNGDGTVNEGKYNRMLLQFSAIRTAYETAASFAMPRIEMPADGVGFAYVDYTFSNGVVDLGGDRQFSSNDAILYAVSFAFTEADKLCQESGKSFGDVLSKYVDAVSNGDEEAVRNANEELKGLFDGISDVADDFVDRIEIGVNTLAVILSDCEYMDTIKNTMDTTIGDRLNDLAKDLKKGEN